jgi:probable phosphoglycerate mutase
MDPPATVMLVRHGKVANPNHVVYADLPGFDLDADGVLQAHAVARHLSHLTVDAVISSPLARAVQTATAIARHHRCDFSIDDGLSEWDLSRGWVGQIWEELTEVVPGQLEEYLAHPESLGYARETLAELASRVVTSIEANLTPMIRNIVVVAHQDPVAVAALRLANQPLSSLLADSPPHASVTTMIRDQTGSWSRRDRWDPPSR